MYAAELAAARIYIPASFPGAIIRRATGTPFMGYAGATYIVQEYCNALFDALFHILPLGTEIDKWRRRRARRRESTAPWDDDALRAAGRIRRGEPFLVRISAAKRMRDRSSAMRAVRGEERVDGGARGATLGSAGTRRPHERRRISHGGRSRRGVRWPPAGDRRTGRASWR